MAFPERRRLELGLVLGFGLVLLLSIGVESRCRRGCDLALASYYLWEGTNLTFISEVLDAQIDEILSFNPQVTDKDIIKAGTRLSVPFSCNCINDDFLGHTFSYSVRPGNTYLRIADLYYANLTTVQWLEKFNNYGPVQIPDNARLNVTVNCSCGDRSVSKDYGLFVTYPLQPGETLSSVAADSGLPSDLIQNYNPNSNFNNGGGLVYIPGKDRSGNYPALKLSKGGLSNGAIAGISVAVVAAALLMTVGIYVKFYKGKKVEEWALLPETMEYSIRHGHGSANTLIKSTESVASVGGASPALTGISMDKSVEFSYEELAKATNDFNLANKIGQGGLELFTMQN